MVLGAVIALQKYVVLPFLPYETANFLQGWGLLTSIPLQASSLYPPTYFNHPISKMRLVCNCNISLKMTRMSQILWS